MMRPRGRSVLVLVGVALIGVLLISCDPLGATVGTERLPVGTIGSPYTASLRADGVAPLRWAASGLPAGLSVRGAQITGTPTKAGAFTAKLTVTGKGGPPATRSLTLVVMTSAQREALDYLNGRRAGLHLSSFGTNAEADLKAQRWAEHLAAAGALSHTTLADGQPSCMRTAGENVGTSNSADAVIDAWMKSPVHFGNISNPKFTRVGIGLAVANNHLYVVAEFLGGC